MLLTVVAALSLSAAPPPKPFIAGPSIEGVSEYSLPNGLKVLFAPDQSSPQVTVNLTVLVGSRHENYGEKGMAHLFEHMLFKKTKKFADVKAELGKLGGDANGTTWLDRTNYFETFPSDEAKLKTAIELEAQRLRSAIISREQLATEMTVVRNEFERGENNPERVLLERVVSAAYLWHNYGNSTIGAKSDIEKVPNERLLAFYDTYYQPDNAVLIVAGRFDEAKTFKVIADTFGKLPKPKRVLPTTYTEEPTHDGETQVTVRRVGGNPVVLAGYHAPPASDPDAAVIDVLSALLGDSPSGRLYKNLVEPKKAARVGCFNYGLREAGYFFCSATMNEKDAPAPARDALLSTLEGLARQPPTAEEVQRAKTALLKNEYELVLNASDRLGHVLSEYIAWGDWRLFFLMRDRVEAVTTDDVVRVAARYLKQANRTLGEYVPTARPDRTEVPAAGDLTATLRDYKGRQSVAQGEAFDASPANIDQRTLRGALSGGARTALLAKKTRGETLRLTLVFKLGNEKALTGKRIAGDFAAAMLSRGTKARTRQQLKDRLDELKAQVSFQPGAQSVTASIEVRRPQLAETLDLVAEMLKSPAFDAKEFEQLKRETLARYEQQKNDPQSQGGRELRRLISPFGVKGHPFYTATIGELVTDTSALKLDDVKAFHGRFYGAQDARLAAVGDFDEAALTAQLEKAFGAWKAPEAYARIAVPFTEMPLQSRVIETPDKPMAFFGAGYTLKLKDSDPDFPALTIADYMLGGGFLNGRVPQRLREKEGWSYSAGTHLDPGQHDDFSAIIGYAICAVQNTDKVEAGFKEEVRLAVEKGFTEAELKAAREGLLKSMESSRADDGELAWALTQQLDLGRTTAFDAAVEARLRKLTLKDINETFRRSVDPSKFSYVKAGDFKPVAAPK